MFKFLAKIGSLKLRMEAMTENLKAFKAEDRGAASSKMIGAIILLSIAAIFLATLFLEALNILANADTTNMTTTTAVLFGLIAIILVLAVIILILEAVGIEVT